MESQPQTDEINKVKAQIEGLEGREKAGESSKELDARMAETLRRLNLLTEQKESATTKRYVTSDVYESVLKGHLLRAMRAAFYTAPVETTGIIGTVLCPPLLVAYGGYFVPWRHQRWPYTENQLTWRNSFGAAIRGKAGDKRVIIGLAMSAWVLDNFKSIMSNMMRPKSS